MPAFQNLAESIRRQAEIWRLTKALKHCQVRGAVQDPKRRGTRLVWPIELPVASRAFLSLRQVPYPQGYVVYVHAPSFYLLWLRSGCPRRAIMPQDYKYHHAAAGFAEGERNPVPLANPTIDDAQARPRIAFVDGITRTYWLIANGASAFPVMVRHETAAERMTLLVGTGQRHVSVSSLFDPVL